jgi:transposase
MSADPLLAVAEEQLRWVRAAALPQVRETIEAALTKTEMRRAYELCDGTHSGVEIGKAVGVSNQSVSNWTRRWRNLGIAYVVDGGAVQHLVSLESLELPLEVE